MPIPSESMPAFFVDLATNCSSTNRISKLTFVRTVFDTDPTGSQSNQPVVQLVMGNDVLLNLYAFIESNIQRLVAEGVYNQSDLENARRAQIPGANNAN